MIPPAGWALLAGAFLVSQVSTYLTKTLWISDSRLYLAWAYRYLGYSETEAAHRTAAHLRGRSGLITCDFCWPAGYEHSFFHGDNGAVVGPRVLYPLLSAPFVWLFGPNGMLVVPVVSYAVGVALLAILAARLLGRWWGVAAGALILLPPLPSRFGLYALTDATALMFTVAGLLCLPLARRARRRDLVWFAILLELGLFTRQFAVTITAGILLTWVLVAIRDRRARNPWLSFAVVSSVLTAGTLAAQNVVASHLYSGDSLSLTQRYQRVTERAFHTDGFAAVPRVLRNMLHVDYRYVRAFDLLLIVIVVFAVVSAFWRFRSELSSMMIGMSASTLALAVLIVDPTYFRYFVPVVPLMVLCVLALIADLTSSPGTRPHWSTEAVPEGTTLPETGTAPEDVAQSAAGAAAAREAQRDTLREARREAAAREAAARDGAGGDGATQDGAVGDGVAGDGAVGDGPARDAVTRDVAFREAQSAEPVPEPQRPAGRYRTRWRQRVTCSPWRQRIATSRWRVLLARVPGLPVAGWALLAAMYLLVVYVMIARSPHQHGYKILALAGFTVAVPAIVVLVARRSGRVAGGIAGIALVLSAPVASASISSSRFSLALLAIIGCLAMLPGGLWPQPGRRQGERSTRQLSGAAPLTGAVPLTGTAQPDGHHRGDHAPVRSGKWSRRLWRAAPLAGFAVLLAVALAVQYRSIILVVGVLVACVAAALRGRGSLWLPYGLISLALGVGSVLADLWVSRRHAQYPHSWFWNSTEWLGRVIRHLARPELTQITGDRVFLACAVLALVAVLVRRGEEWTCLAAGAFAAGLVLVVFNNRADHLFYLTLAFPPMVLVAADLVVGFAGRPPEAPTQERELVRSPGGHRVPRKKMRTARVSV
ncbi:hypothetical protein Raf01_21340 [Rugosimonospora africana]|uniref:Dolichyl-phosphate-mannose-protein mannosyltransferase n=1 Tax=Rugosimonospora africana TaxID=556532 RepID=A0A8J3VPH2_9ACTN|nr:hypothetical protein Raf01_21340 [Rugosimonospora africana]